MEILLKTLFKNAKPKELSSISPAKYQRRFMKFLKSDIFIDLFQNQKLSKKYKLVSIDNQTKELIELYNKNYSEANLKLN